MRKLPALLGIVIASLAGVLVHCGRTADTGGDAGASAGPDSGHPGFDPYPGDGDAGPDAASMVDASDALDASTLPDVSCADDDAAACDFIPPSTCADMKSVLYFSDGTCTSGVCTWTTKSLTCGFQSYCASGGCTPPTTK